MQANTQAVSIDASAQAVLDLVADVEQLPRWAIGFAKAVTRRGDGWLVETGQGPMSVEIEADEQRGTVDFRMRPADGGEAVAYSRVIPRGDGCEYVFTQFQSPGMPDDVFDAQVTALAHELSVLKALVEVRCPL